MSWYVTLGLCLISYVLGFVTVFIRMGFAMKKDWDKIIGRR